MSSSTSPKRSNSKKMGRNHSPHHHHHHHAPSHESSRRHHHHQHHIHQNAESPPPPILSRSVSPTTEMSCQTEAKDWPISTSINDLIKILPQFLPMGWSMYPIWNGISFFQCSLDVSKWEAFLTKTIVISEPSATSITTYHPGGGGGPAITLSPTPTLFHVLIRTKEGGKTMLEAGASGGGGGGGIAPKVVESSSWKYFSQVTDILALLEDGSPCPPAVILTDVGVQTSSSPVSSSAVSSAISSSTVVPSTSSTPLSRSVPSTASSSSTASATLASLAPTSVHPPFLTLLPPSSSLASSSASSSSTTTTTAERTIENQARILPSTSTTFGGDAPPIAHLQIIPAPPFTSSAAAALAAVAAHPASSSNVIFHQSPHPGYVVGGSTTTTTAATTTAEHPQHAHLSLYSIESLNAPSPWHAPSSSKIVASTSSSRLSSSIPTSLVEYHLPTSSSTQAKSSSSSIHASPILAAAAATHPIPPTPLHGSHLSTTLITPASTSTLSSSSPPDSKTAFAATATAASLVQAQQQQQPAGGSSTFASSVTMNYLNYNASGVGVANSPALTAVGLTSPPSIIHHQPPPPPLAPLSAHSEYNNVHVGEGGGAKDVSVVTSAGATADSAVLSSIINNSENDFYSAFQIALALGVGAAETNNNPAVAAPHFLQTAPPTLVAATNAAAAPQLHAVPQLALEAVETTTSTTAQAGVESVYKQMNNVVKRETKNNIETIVGETDEKYRRLSSSSSGSSNKNLSVSSVKSNNSTPTLQQQLQQQQLQQHHHHLQQQQHQHQQHQQPECVSPNDVDSARKDGTHPPPLTAVSPPSFQHEQLQNEQPQQQHHHHHHHHPHHSPAILSDSPPRPPPLPPPDDLSSPKEEDDAKPRKNCVCGHCGKSFAYKSLMQKHIKRMHKDKTEGGGGVNNEVNNDVYNVINVVNGQPGEGGGGGGGGGGAGALTSINVAATNADEATTMAVRLDPNKTATNPTMKLDLAMEERTFVIDADEDGDVDENVNDVEPDIDNAEPSSRCCPKCGTPSFQGTCLKPGCSSPRPFKCPICKKGFTKKCHLTAHERIHTGERPFRCPQCVQAFSEKSKLNRHMKIHSGEKPFRCCACLKAFTEKRSLKVHVQRLHSGNPNRSPPQQQPQHQQQPQQSTTPPQVHLTSTAATTASTATTPSRSSSAAAHSSSGDLPASPVATPTAAPTTSTTTVSNATEAVVTELPPSSALSPPRIVTELKNVFSSSAPPPANSVNIVHPSGGIVTFPAFPHGSTIVGLPTTHHHHHHPHETTLSSLLPNAVDVVATSATSPVALHHNHHPLSAHLVHHHGGVEHTIQLPHGTIQLPLSAAGQPVTLINPKTLMQAMQAQNLSAANAAGLKAAAAAVAAAAGHATIDATPLFTSPHL